MSNSIPRPFLKWAGSKRLLLEHLKPHIPTNFNRYFEPFLGGASMFFYLDPGEATLGDTSKELISTYKSVSQNIKNVINHLREFNGSKEEYYKIRSNRSKWPYKNAAEFIYLNKTCWNGLYRVNLQGEFNVPYGLNKLPIDFDLPNLRLCSKILNKNKVNIINVDFEKAVSNASKGDFVFLDPPYVTTHKLNGFIEYNEKIFGWIDQVRLCKLAKKLRDKGCHVIITNADHHSIIDLYKDFNIIQLKRNSTLASDPLKRREVSELIII